MSSDGTDCILRPTQCCIHWRLCRSCRSQNWCQHHPDPVTENKGYKLLYNFNIFTDKVISARCPDLVYVDKEKKQTDIACVMDRNVVNKEKEKIDKYLNLLIEL